MFAQVLKDAEASRKAWLLRTRAIQHGGKETGWVNADGSKLDAKTLKFVQSVKIPPGWSDVHVTTDPESDLLATGKDSKSRPVSRYSAKFSEGNAAAKFARVSALHPKIPKLVATTAKDMGNKKLSPRERDNAATVYLVTKTGFRPGSTKDTKAAEQAFGASTLERRHIKVKGDTISFQFTGKKAVAITKTLKDAKMAEYLSERLPTLKPEDKVFQSSGASAMTYLRKVVGNNFMLKDLRTWNGTAVAKHLISKEDPPVSAAQLKDQQRRISTAVSSHLGNTPAMALKAYIDPSVWVDLSKTTAVRSN